MFEARMAPLQCLDDRTEDSAIPFYNLKKENKGTRYSNKKDSEKKESQSSSKTSIVHPDIISVVGVVKSPGKEKMIKEKQKSKKVTPMKTFVYLFGVLRRFQHCTGHITTGSWKGRGNQYIQFVRVLYCKLPTNGKQLPAFPLEAVPGIEPRPQRWEARVLPLCHRGPYEDLCRERLKIIGCSMVGRFSRLEAIWWQEFLRSWIMFNQPSKQ